MADKDFKALLNELVDFDGIVKRIVNELKESLEEEVLRSDEGDKIAEKLDHVFDDKEHINEFIDNTVEEAQYLAQQKEGARKDAEKFVAMLKEQAKQTTAVLNEEEDMEVKKAIGPFDQVEEVKPTNLVSAVDLFFSLTNSEESAQKFSEEVQGVLIRHSSGRFGFMTETGVDYGKFSLRNNRILLESGSKRVEYDLQKEDITNEELLKKLFPPSEEYESAGPDMCSCGNEYCDEVECIDHEYDEELPYELEFIIEEIEEAEEEFYDSVEVILQGITRHYSKHLPTVKSMTDDDEVAMRFFLAHSSTLYSPAALTALSTDELLHEFTSKFNFVVPS